MGLIAKVLSFARVTRHSAKFTEVKADPGAGAIVVAEQFAPSGDDSPPLVYDYMVIVPTTGSGRGAVVGYIDTENEGEAAAGERRMYSRDSGGNIKSVLWLKADGSVTVSNDTGSFELQAGGDIVLNGVTINTSGEINASKVSAPSVEAGGKELAGHTHTPGTYSNSGGPVVGVSGGNV
jgi:hypothetical protein